MPSLLLLFKLEHHHIQTCEWKPQIKNNVLLVTDLFEVDGWQTWTWRCMSSNYNGYSIPISKDVLALLYAFVCPAKVIQFQAKMVSCKYIHRWSFSKLLPTSHGFHVVELLSLTHLLVVIVWTCRWLVTSIADLLTSSVLGPFFVLHWCLYQVMHGRCQLRVHDWLET